MVLRKYRVVKEQVDCRPRPEAGGQQDQKHVGNRKGEELKKGLKKTEKAKKAGRNLPSVYFIV